MYLDIFSLLAVISASQGFFLFYMLYVNKKKTEEIRLLALILLLLSILVLYPIFSHQILASYQHIFSIFLKSLVLLFGPVVYLYITIVCKKNKKSVNAFSYHFFLALVLFFVIQVAKSIVFSNVLNLIVLLHATFYIVKSLLHLGRNIDKSYKFYLNLAILFSLLISIIYLLSLLNNSSGIFFKYLSVAHAVCFSIFACKLIPYINYYTDKKKCIFKDDKSSSIKKSKKSQLKEEELKRYWKQLIIIMEEEKLFLTHTLSSTDIASKLNIPRQYLSQILRDCGSCNFYEFVNSYRIREFKRLLQLGEHKKYTLLSLSYSIGFNSKTTFNTAFKKNTGVSPSQYISSLNL